MELGPARSRPLPPGNNATNAARRVPRRTRGQTLSGLGGLGFISPGVPTPVMYEWYDAGGGMMRRVVGPTMGTTDPGSGAYLIVKNPDYVPPGYYIAGSARALGTVPHWSFANVHDAASFFANKPTNGVQLNMPFISAEHGMMSGPVYFSSPQFEADMIAWTTFGASAGYLKSSTDDWISKTIQAVVEIAAIAGVGYGLYAVAGAALASGAAPASAAPAAVAPVATETAASVAPLYGGVGTAGAGAGTDAILATGAATTAGGTAVTAAQVAGGLKTAKDAYGVLNTIRALTSRPSAPAPVPTLDTSYGNGGFPTPASYHPPPAPGFSMNTLLWIGGGAFALLLTAVLLSGRSKAKV